MLAAIARAAATGLAALFVTPALGDSCIWYSYEDSIHQVETTTNQVTRVLPLKHPHRLAMNAEDCGVWTLDKHDRRLLRFNAEGTLEKEIRVAELHPQLGEVERLQLDPYDGSLWIADERRLFHISSAGALLASFPAPGEIRGLRVALDQTVWVLGKRELWRFDAQGILLASYALGGHLAADARYFAIDNLGGLIWLADEQQLARLSLVNPAEPPLRMRLRHQITGFALDPFSGNVWVAQREALFAFSRAGALVHSVDLEALGIRKPEKLAFDPASRSLWAGAEKSVSRFSDTGQFVIRFSARDSDEALGVPAFRVQPTLTPIRPPQDALSNNPRPEFRLGYGADCNGSSCGFPVSYFSQYQLSATMNDQPVGSAFQFDASSIESSFTPSTRLPEGQNTFNAQVKDGFGHSSNVTSISFTVDTVAPQFLTLTPSHGSVLRTPQATIEGTVDDPLATVVLETSGLVQSGQRFAFPVTLQPGPNVFTLSAIDHAGNRSTVSLELRLVLNTVAVEIQTPTNSATLLGPTVAVSGTFQGPANTGVTANGQLAATFDNRYFALVPVVVGPNTINVVATAPDGTKATQAITVMVTGNAAISLDVRPAQGVAPLATSFRMTKAADRTIVLIEADYDGDGTVDFTTTDSAALLVHTYAAPGVYGSRFSVRDDLGNTHVLAQTVVVRDPAETDQLFKAMWSDLTQALAAGNKAAALSFLNPAAQAKFGPIFDALMPNMAAIVNSFSPLLGVSQSDTIAQYAIVRPNGAHYSVYLIYFVTDENGVWRLDEM